MKTLDNILSAINVLQFVGNTQQEIVGLAIHANEVKDNYLFIAQEGTLTDGHTFIPDAIKNGAKVIVCSKSLLPMQDGIAYVFVQNTKLVAGVLAAAFYDYPSSQLKIVGITGTNGKTTCATLAYQLFSNLGFTCGLLSTVQNQIAKEILPSTHTTPNPIQLQNLLRKMVDADCSYVFMEVSSHAIHQGRIEGIQFAGACFTNITHDHLDYHKTFDEYIRVKKSFFDHLPKEAFAISNADDKRGMVMLQNTKAKKISYALKSPADVKGKIVENSLQGLHLLINGEEVIFRMIGEFNAYNILCVYAIALQFQLQKQEVLQVLSTLIGADGRFECILSPIERILGIVDYAHTPDALLNVLATINKLRSSNETLFTIIGCGGDRDKQKRPIMGLVACEHSDKVIFTSDNPRSEDATAILQEMEDGVAVHQRKKYVRIADRKEAIKTACSIAESGDIILVAGKGHEKYQEINGERFPFDDKKILQEMFELLEK